MTQHFLTRKVREFEELRLEIEQLQLEALGATHDW